MQHFYKNIQGWFTTPKLYTEAVKKANNNAKFVEVGCWKGKSTAFIAVEIINSKKNITVDCIDLWNGNGHDTIKTIEQQEELYREFLKNTETIRHITRPIRAASKEGAKLYEDNSLDFVFLDTSHNYEDVMADIYAWFPKVKKGGILAGHDYGLPWVDVIQAVNTFFNVILHKKFHKSEYSWIYYKE